MSAGEFEQFREAAVHDGALRAQLRPERDVERFVALAVVSGRERGFDFSPEDVEAALVMARRRWRERW